MDYNFKIYKLHFTTPLHLGDERGDYSISMKMLHSDSFYGAVFSALAKIGRNLPYDGDLGFTISSLFPFYQKDSNSDPVLFFPKLLRQLMPSSKHQRDAKKIKKVQWLDKDFFQKMIHGNNIFDENLDVDCISGSYLTKNEVEANFISSKVSQRVTVPRDPDEESTPFYMDRLLFKDWSGLFFIVSGDTTELELALKVLKDEGIGTDRTVGNGLFEWDDDDVKIDIPTSDFATNLSLFCPEDQQQLEEMTRADETAWDFKRRGGWITSAPFNTYRKNSIHMFSEASVFHLPQTREPLIKGKIEDLKPEVEFEDLHPVWRFGKALLLPVIPV